MRGAHERVDLHVGDARRRRQLRVTSTSASACRTPRTARFGSPFDYEQQTLLYLPRGLDAPSSPRQTAQVVDAALAGAARPAAAARSCCSRVIARCAMRPRCCGRGSATGRRFPCWCRATRRARCCSTRFREHGNAVLLGTSSFWEGVDVKGAALSVVVIDKLPFAAPDDPVLKARLEAIERRGGNPFFEEQIPQAVIALKQGVGRLMRDPDDFGVIMLCDQRLRTRGYGRMFLDSLPPMPRTEQLEDVEQFLRTKLARRRHRRRLHAKAGERMMKMLAIDTATERCSVALLLDGASDRAIAGYASRSCGSGAAHGRIGAAGRPACVCADLDGLAYGRGPGAFTGRAYRGRRCAGAGVRRRTCRRSGSRISRRSRSRSRSRARPCWSAWMRAWGRSTGAVYDATAPTARCGQCTVERVDRPEAVDSIAPVQVLRRDGLRGLSAAACRDPAVGCTRTRSAAGAGDRPAWRSPSSAPGAACRLRRRSPCTCATRSRRSRVRNNGRPRVRALSIPRNPPAPSSDCNNSLL